MSSDPFPRPLPDIALASERETTIELRDVVGPSDERRRVQNTRQYPASVIAQLIVVLRDGSEWGATATFIGPRTLITAAHALYLFHDDPGRAGRVDHVVVIPARDGSNYPFGFVKSDEFYIPDSWINGRSIAHDYGLVFVPPREGDDVMFPMALPDAQLRGLKVYVAGYPLDKPVGTQWYDGREIRDVSDSQLLYDLDTEDGQSGSAVFAFRDEKAYAVGLHRFGRAAGNLGTRITPTVMDDIRTRIF